MTAEIHLSDPDATSGATSGATSDAPNDVSAVDRIRRTFDELTATEQEAARFILGHLTDVLVCNSAELAELSGVSQPTMSRLYRKLGYANAGEFRRDVRRFHQPGSPELANVGEDDEAGGLVASHMDRELTAVRRTFSRLDETSIRQAAKAIVDARRVCVIGLRNGYPIALHLREQLIQLRADVCILPQPGQSIAEEIVDYGPADIAIVIGVRRRPATFPALVAALADARVPMIVIGDATVRSSLPASAPPITVLEADLSSHVLSSYTAAFALAALLVDAVSDCLPAEESAARISAINRLFDDMGELESSRRRQ
ncbi:MurR/RpiR family transcriptional regulator [Bifidobacterium callitrichos]|uniref:MurR/RpiR family transcriptional regulator n=1 Tax=Bifidobacterium callitrichos TaxID=762209 RepID=A0A5M9ZCA6_9BIFI|nr:MurR/RpiR family transcriptional regulator [Bifidobacterium callitrichos]KAA8816330.1 MurR/RpiR family transcriptional regulator [Bifidobacterium callitrichos]